MSDHSASVAGLRVRDAVLLTIAALCSWLFVRLALPADVDAAVIPTLTTLAIRHFRKGKEEGEHVPKHPAVKFVLGAWNEGDFAEAEKHVSPSCAFYANGYAVEPSPGEGGPALAQESIEHWRAIVPDIRMELEQEIREKDRIAIEWLITGTHTGDRPELPASGNEIELQGSVFLTLEDGKIVEAWTVFDGLALAVQTGAAEAPSWWPGRGSS